MPNLSPTPCVLRGPARPDLLRDETLGDLLTATAARRPRHPALVWGQRTITYAELEFDRQAIAQALQEQGAAPGKIIGLLLPRGADLLIAQAAITGSGAAWLPFDAETPLDRVQTCLASAGALGLLTTRAWLPRFAGLPVPVWAVEDLRESPPRAPRPAPRARPEDPAYVIYTSGSTGAPKGIVLSHRSICHFLRSENEILGVRETDRIYQGFSVAFDMSFEEIWIAYLVGATLWIAPPALVGDPEALAAALNREYITVLHAVPTLLALLTNPLPKIRLLNLGGEACPDALARRLVAPGRQVFNTYGPTETAVSATLAELRPGEPVTIGRPLPNYGLLILDADGRPAAAGVTGELCIFGPGLALGYLNRPELTADRFVPNPLAASPAEARMYRTGDLARIDPGGLVHCLGRVDNQIKLRGFRIELDEITAALTAQPGVAAAAAVVRRLGDTDQIVAFLIPAGDHKPNPAALRAALAARLPAYMVPAHFEIASSLPRLASGKINTAVLREVLLQTAAPDSAAVPPQTPEEAVLYDVLKKMFPGAALRPDADFFNDLGGHSLLAAKLVSTLRADPRYPGLGVQDVYRERTLAGLARVLERVRHQKAGTAPLPARDPVPAARHFRCGLAQAAVIPFFVLLHMADWLAPFFVYQYYTGDPGDSIPLAVLRALTVFVCVQLANFAIAILGKRLLVGRLKPGVHPLWGRAYFRWWLGEKFTSLPDVHLLAATPWLPLYLRALGARIGRDTVIENLSLAVPELLTVGDGACLGNSLSLENARVAGGRLHLGTITIGRDAVVDAYAVLEENTVVGAGARLRGLSALAAGGQVPAGEVWEGAPARPAAPAARAPLPPREIPGPLRRALLAAAHAFTALVVSVLFFLPTFPAFMLIDWVDAHTWDIFDSELGTLPAFGIFFLLAIPASALLVSLTLLLTAALRRLLPRQRAGRYSIHSFVYWHNQLITLILDLSLQTLHGLYASVYAPAWLRLLGARVGRHSEISTAEGMVPELLTLGDDSFIADAALLGDKELRGGWLILSPTVIGSRSFIGNGAYVSDGTVVPDDVLIGVQTRVPANDQMHSGQTWLGSPAVLLPARENTTGFPAELTFRPSLWRRLGRGLFEGLRLVLPLALIIATGYWIVVLVMPLAADQGWGWQVGLALALAGCLFGLGSFLLVVALKWLTLGRYRPRSAPMWTAFVWTSEAITNLYESLAVPNFLDLLRGTPMLPWALRLLGVRLGRQVWLNTTDFTEFDCITIGDGAELNAWSGPQTHLFEDRVMKIGRVHIGAQVTVGARSTILYDTHVGDGVRLGPLTLVAKGERLPPATAWTGSPATPG